MRKEITIDTTLLDALSELFPETSRTTLRQMLQQDRIRVNGAQEKNARRALRSGDVVAVAPRSTVSALDSRLSIVYEDEWIIVIDKASGLLTVASPGEKDETVQAFLNEYLQTKDRRARIHVVHRLDRDSSGVLVFAKDFETRELLKARFAEHDIDRVYVAIIVGSISPPSGTIRSFLDEDSAVKVRTVRNPAKGKQAISHYRTIERGERYSMLEVRLETGRKNQIRVHLAESGHPIVGDSVYGNGDPLVGRLALHAKLLGFVHPHTEKKLVFTSPIPDVFRKAKL